MAGLASITLVTGLAVVGLPASATTPEGEPASDRADVEQEVLDQLSDEGTATFWIYLRAQADTSAATQMADRAEQGWFVYEKLTATAERSQAGLVTLLNDADVDYESFWIANTIKVTGGDSELLDRIAARPEVEQITGDRVYEIPEPEPADEEPGINAVEWNIDRVKAPQVWSGFGVTGEDIVVGAIDTGAQFDHPALVNQYRGNNGDGTFDHNYNWWDPSNVCGNPSLVPCDNNNHGTHVTGTMVGDDGGTNQIGMAPGAKWMMAKGCESSSCSQSALLSSGQFILAPTDLQGENANPELRPHIVNNSWGGGATTDPWYRPTVQAWVDAGIFPQFASGNPGSACGAAGNPGNLPESYAAGAFDINDNLYVNSGRGPSAWGSDIIKPNIAAPGVAVRSSVAGNGYASFTGTSMASPHVAGAVALMWSAAPSLVRDIDTTRELLDLTAEDTEDLTCGGTPENNNVWGQGKLDAFLAVEDSPRGPTGLLEGTVSDAETDDPIEGATVTITGEVDRVRTTDADGGYGITLPVGGYDVTASAFGYQPTTTQVTVTEDQTITQDFDLVPVDNVTVSGTVTDGSGHGWPLYARIEVSGAPISDVFTDPASGSYSLDVPEGTTFTLTVDAVSDGYNAESREITAEPGGQVEDFALTVGTSCTAPGYDFVPASGASADDVETGTTGGTLAVSPAAVGDGSLTTTFASNNGFAGNTFDLNPIAPLMLTGFDVNITAPGTEHTVTIYWKEGTADGFESDPEAWTLLGSDVVVSAGQNEPTHADIGGLQVMPGTTYGIYVDLESYPSGTLRYTNGGPQTFSNDELELTTYVGKANPAFLGSTFSFRMWNGTVHYDIGDFECSPIPGGLLVGNVRDANTGESLNDAAVTSDNEPADTTTTFGTPDDPGVDDGFYILFSSLTGMQPFTATKDLYGPDTQTPDVVADDVVVQDFNLPVGLIEPDPTSIEIEALLGDTATTTLALNNVGGLDADFEISDVETTGAPSVSLPPSDGDFPRGEPEASALAAPTDSGPLPDEDVVPEGTGIELAPGSPAYAQNAAFGYYTVFDLEVPEVLPNVAPFDTGSFIGAGEFVRGSVFMIDGTHTMYEVDPETGDVLDSIPVTPPGGSQNYTGMALDPTSGTVYAASCDISTSQLFELDVASGEATLIGTISNSPCAIGIAVDGSGQMFAYDIVNDSLISIDKATAEGTIIGSLGFDANFGQGMAWDPETDTLFLAAFNSSAFQPELRVADRETGNTALVGVLGEDDPGGLNQLGYMGIELAGDALWLSEDPTAGTVPAGGSTDVVLTFEATPENGITHPGDYTAQLLVSTNTPTEVAPIPVTLTVPPDGFGTFQGSVLGQAGPVPDATVEALQEGEVIESTTTDVLGRYTLQVPPDTYDLRAVKGDQQAIENGVTVRADRSVTVNFQITEGVGTFTGKVTGGRGGPVPDATVEALQDGEVIASTTTDFNGNYTLQVPPDSYDLRAFKGEREATATDVTVGPDQTVTVNLKLPSGGGPQP
ncbi:MAG TPA: carboxypeptidase regulatory-like domain-containing protein [Jiangellaceae bacterium]